MTNEIKPLVSIYHVNSSLLYNTFTDVTEEISLKRPNKKTNSMMFILLHTIDARYFLLKELGVKISNPFAKYVDWANTIDDIKTYPKLKRVLSEWKKLDVLFLEKLSRLQQKKLSANTNYDFPGGKKVIDMISFLAEHEAYHVGQLAYVRKFLGLKAVMF